MYEKPENKPPWTKASPSLVLKHVAGSVVTPFIETTTPESTTSSHLPPQITVPSQLFASVIYIEWRPAHKSLIIVSWITCKVFVKGKLPNSSTS